jgi:hypothetical protein
VHQNTETITLQKSFNNQKLQKSNHLQILNNDLMVLHSAQKKRMIGQMQVPPMLATTSFEKLYTG